MVGGVIWAYFRKQKPPSDSTDTNSRQQENSRGEMGVTKEQVESSPQLRLIPCHNKDSNTLSTGASSVDPNNNEILPVQDLVKDFTDIFATHECFSSRDTLFDWVRARGKEHGFVVIIGRSDNGWGNKAPRLLMTCERSGQYREKNSALKSSHEKNEGEIVEQVDRKKGKRKRESGTKKCGCPFSLKGRQVGELGEWKLDVICGVHNHPTVEHLEGCSYSGSLLKPKVKIREKPKEKSDEKPKEKSDEKPKEKTEEKAKEKLKEKSEEKPNEISEEKAEKKLDEKLEVEYVTEITHVSRRNECDGRSQMQQLMQKLKEHGYYHVYRSCEKTNKVKDLFFAHLGNIELLRAFPYVILMDCTYKTTRYKLPLLEIVGVTSTQMTFSIAAAYLEFEREDDYIWACTVLKSLMDQSCLPNVIVTDREIALMNAVDTTFPTSRHLLCRWHINKNILANCKKILRTKESWDAFNLNWNLLVLADTELKFNDMVNRLSRDFNKFPNAVKYVMEQWVTPYKERFVSYWTNNVMHFDNMITNRVESQHALLKKQLGSNQGDFETCWQQIDTINETLHIAIKHSFEKSKFLVKHKFKSILFEELRGMVSIHALELIFAELNSLDENGVDALSCRCVLRKTCGLPCPHDLTEFVRLDSPIPLNKVHDFWRKLDTSTATKDVVGVRHEQDSQLKDCWTNLELKFDQATEYERTLILNKLTEILIPTSMTIEEIDGDCDIDRS